MFVSKFNQQMAADVCFQIFSGWIRLFSYENLTDQCSRKEHDSKLF